MNGARVTAMVFGVAVAACSSASGSNGSANDAGVAAEDGAAPTLAGCDGAPLLAQPSDPSARGAWPVGAKTVTIGALTAEVWYPATPGSDTGKTNATYDLREHLPSADKKKIPDADNPLQPCDCVRDLPFDGAHGPYPVVVFVHGTAGFRTQSLTFMTHWASRGFVVVAADHPGITLGDVLGGGAGAAPDQAGDARKLLAALRAPTGDIAFLASHVDASRMALAGHSAGGGAIATLGSEQGVRVIIPMAARGTDTGSDLKSTLVLGAKSDGIALYSRAQDGFAASPVKRRLVGIANAGHLAFSDLCAIGKEKGGLLQIATDHGVSVNPLIARLSRDGCGADQLAPEAGWKIVDYATSAVLEETLQCSKSSAAALAQIKTAVPNVAEYLEQLQ
jgi:hypothetical protein